jgi:hypothetical protein
MAVRRRLCDLAVLGRDDEHLIQALPLPRSEACFPAGWNWDQPSCHCMPHSRLRAIRPWRTGWSSSALRCLAPVQGWVGRSVPGCQGSRPRLFCRHLAGGFQAPLRARLKALDVDNQYGRRSLPSPFDPKVRFSGPGCCAWPPMSRPGGAGARMSSVLGTRSREALYRAFLCVLDPAFLGRYIWNMAGVLLGS